MIYEKGESSNVVTVAATLMAIDGGRWLPASWYKSRQSFITRAKFSQKPKLSTQPIARTETWMILDEARTNGWPVGQHDRQQQRDKQVERMLLISGILFLVFEATSNLLTIPSRKFPE